MTEAAVDAKSGKTRGGKLRGLVARRKKDRSDREAAVPSGYRTFSRKLAPGLIAVGSAATLAGALGAWIRTSQVVTEGLQEEQIGAVMGYESDWGRLMALVAGIALVSSLAWLWRNLWFKLLSLAATLSAIALSVWRLPIINDAAAALADQARTGEVGFISYHAGFGWGAWLLVVGAVGLFLGMSVGILRELDVRRGVEE